MIKAKHIEDGSLRRLPPKIGDYSPPTSAPEELATGARGEAGALRSGGAGLINADLVELRIVVQPVSRREHAGAVGCQVRFQATDSRARVLEPWVRCGKGEPHVSLDILDVCFG